MKETRTLIISSFLLTFFILMPGITLAHKIIVFAWAEGNTVYTESHFNSGKSAKNSQVQVLNSNGNLLHSGRTDLNGSFIFKIQSKQNLRIEVDAGSGHKGFWNMTEHDFEESHSFPDPKIPVNNDTERDVVLQALSKPSGDYQLSENDFIRIESLIEKVVEKKTAVFRTYLIEEKTKGPGAKDIFTGLGYIFGITGIIAYINSRKKRTDESRGSK